MCSCSYTFLGNSEEGKKFRGRGRTIKLAAQYVKRTLDPITEYATGKVTYEGKGEFSTDLYSRKVVEVIANHNMGSHTKTF